MLYFTNSIENCIQKCISSLNFKAKITSLCLWKNLYSMKKFFEYDLSQNFKQQN